MASYLCVEAFYGENIGEYVTKQIAIPKLIITVFELKKDKKISKP